MSQQRACSAIEADRTSVRYRRHRLDGATLRAWRREAMPTGNATEMTEEERAILGAWIAAGAKLD